MQFLSIIFILSLFYTGTILGAPVKKRQKKTPKEPAPTSLINRIKNAPLNLVDGTQEVLDENVTRVANRLDSFFGNQRADDELNRSQLRLSYSYQLAETVPKDDFAFRVNLRMSNIENYFKTLIDKTLDWEVKKTPKQIAKEEKERRKKEDPHNWLWRNDVGVIASVPPRAFYRSRLRKTISGKDIVHRFVEELAWFSQEQWINTATFESDRAMTMSMLFRMAHQLNWAITDEEFTTSHGPSIIHTISARDAMSYNARVLTRVKGPYYLDGYSLSINYRRRVRGNWLYGEVTPALDFPKVTSFRRTPSILFKIEALFGGIREDITSQNSL